jgi:hypothetical protein
MLEDPSRGSKVTMYFPEWAVSISMTVSFSSDTCGREVLLKGKAQYG